MPSQRKKLLPWLKSESESEMVKILDQYKRIEKLRPKTDENFKVLKKGGGNKDLVVTIG
jgi:hypothetical protein